VKLRRSSSPDCAIGFSILQALPVNWKHSALLNQDVHPILRGKARPKSAILRKGTFLVFSFRQHTPLRCKAPPPPSRTPPVIEDGQALSSAPSIEGLCPKRIPNCPQSSLHFTSSCSPPPPRGTTTIICNPIAVPQGATMPISSLLPNDVYICPPPLFMIDIVPS